MKNSICAVTLSMTLVLPSALAADAVAETAPLFRAKTLGGEEVGLADYRGRRVLLEFWATWCPPCREQLPRLAQLESENPDLAILAVSVDRRSANIERFRERLAVPETILLDPAGTVAERFGVAAMPWTVLIDEAGDIVWAKSKMQEEDYRSLQKKTGAKERSE